MKSKKIAIVIQRYGMEVNGGAEHLTRMIAERLAVYSMVEVYTTCAIDHVSWRNEYPAGSTWINGVKVNRFAVDRARDMSSFVTFHQNIESARYDFVYQSQWAQEQGPYSSKLIAEIESQRNSHDVFLFFTYLYYHAIYGIPFVSNKSILIPFAHDEPMLYIPIYKNVFNSSRYIIYQTEEEKKLVEMVFKIKNKPSGIAGSGVDFITVTPKSDTTSDVREIKALYIGRIEEGKGCDQMFEFITQYNKSYGHKILLKLIGKANMPIPKEDFFIHLGFVSEDEKWNEIITTDILIIPSKYESLSMVLLEAMSMGKPVVVNAECEVLRAHCLKSNAGLYYRNFKEFDLVIQRLSSDKALKKMMGSNGVEYVRKNYSWERVMKTYVDAIESII